MESTTLEVVNGKTIGKFIIPNDILKNRAKMFDNGWNQNDYVIDIPTILNGYEYGDDNILIILKHLFYNNEAFEPKDVDQFIIAYMIFDHLMVDCNEYLKISEELRNQFKTLEDYVPLFKICVSLNDDFIYAQFLHNNDNVDVFDINICCESIIDISDSDKYSLFNRQIKLIMNEEIYKKYVSDEYLDSVHQDIIKRIVKKIDSDGHVIFVNKRRGYVPPQLKRIDINSSSESTWFMLLLIKKPIYIEYIFKNSKNWMSFMSIVEKEIDTIPFICKLKDQEILESVITWYIAIGYRFTVAELCLINNVLRDGDVKEELRKIYKNNYIVYELLM